ncbi:hypothetical protein BDV95DRAFT_453199, partial [Massariosphaeria phaeospora]
SVSKLKSIHLLRALLRETTYLPDRTARQYFTRHVVHRFRAYQPSQNQNAARVDRHRRRHLSAITARTRATQKTAQKSLNYLRRANQGELPCLQKVLLLAYGRLGKRKYALMNQFLKPDVVPGGDGVVAPPPELGPLQRLYHCNERFLSVFSAPRKLSETENAIEVAPRFGRLKLVLKSQVKRSIAISRPLKRDHLKMPIHNVWMRPMPVKRARNIVRRWYADVMTRLLPPLPDQEWLDLEAMTNGTKRIDFARRRTPATELDPQPVPDEARLTTLLQDALALDKPSKADRPIGPQRPHTVNVRFMRRLYSKIFNYCCKLDWDEQSATWIITWGSPPKEISPRIYLAPTDGALFAGVDLRGRM